MRHPSHDGHGEVLHAVDEHAGSVDRKGVRPAGVEETGPLDDAQVGKEGVGDDIVERARG